MRGHNRTSPRKKLPPLVKVKLAAIALVAVLSDSMTDKQADRFLREATGT